MTSPSSAATHVRAPTGRAQSPRAAGEFLVDMLRSIPGKPDSADADQLARVDIARLVRAATYHGLDPALFLTVESELDPASEPFQQLKDAHLRQLARHLRVLADVRLLGDALDAAQVPWVVVKGPVLAETYWGRPDLRRYADLDVVVGRRSMPVVLDVLADIGGQPVDVNWTMILQQVRGEMSYSLPAGTALDLHWHIINESNLRPQFRFPMEEMLARRRHVKLGATQVMPTWDPCDTVLHVACHFARSGGHHLVWLKDLELTAAAPDVDWDVLVQRARAYGLELVMAATLSRVERVLRPVAPPEILRSLRGRSVWISMTTFLDRTQSPQRLPSRGLSGQAAFTSIRRTTLASLMAFLKHVPVVLRERRPVRHEHSDDNVLHHESGGSDARRAYLAKITGAEQP